MLYEVLVHVARLLGPQHKNVYKRMDMGLATPRYAQNVFKRLIFWNSKKAQNVEPKG